MTIYENYNKQVEDFYSHKINRITCASEYENFAHITHRNRLDKYGLWIHLATKDRSDHDIEFHMEDGKYSVSSKVLNINEVRTIVKTNENKGIYRRSGDKMRTICCTDLVNKDFTEDTLVNCPNCGSPELISTIRNGCPFCGTSFEMTDLFPSIANCYDKPDMYVSTKDAGGNPVGRYAKAYGRLFTLFSEAGKDIKMLQTVGNSQKEYQEFMKQYRPDFSFKQFGSEAISLITILLYSENPSSLPFVNLPNTTALIPQLVDYKFEGFGIYNKQYSMNENMIASVKVVLFAEGYYAVDGEIRSRADQYIVTLQKDIGKPVDYGFSFSKINCDSCGAVFNALKNSNCPYCKTKYQLKKDTWNIVSFERA